MEPLRYLILLVGFAVVWFAALVRWSYLLAFEELPKRIRKGERVTDEN